MSHHVNLMEDTREAKVDRRIDGPRIPVEAVASIQSGSRQVKARVINLGVGGMALDTDPSVSLERFLRIHVRLEPGVAPIDVDAIVHRREPRDGAVRWGVELVEPSAAAIALIEDCIERRRASEASAPSEPAPATQPEPSVQPASRSAAEDPELRGLFQSALESLGF